MLVRTPEEAPVLFDFRTDLGSFQIRNGAKTGYDHSLDLQTAVHLAEQRFQMRHLLSLVFRYCCRPHFWAFSQFVAITDQKACFIGKFERGFRRLKVVETSRRLLC